MAKITTKTITNKYRCSHRFFLIEFSCIFHECIQHFRCSVSIRITHKSQKQNLFIKRATRNFLGLNSMQTKTYPKCVIIKRRKNRPQDEVSHLLTHNMPLVDSFEQTFLGNFYQWKWLKGSMKRLWCWLNVSYLVWLWYSICCWNLLVMYKANIIWNDLSKYESGILLISDSLFVDLVRMTGLRRLHFDI